MGGREISRKFWSFLVSVDEPAKPDDFLRKAAGAFIQNDVDDYADLVGFDVADCSKGANPCVEALAPAFFA